MKVQQGKNIEREGGRGGRGGEGGGDFTVYIIFHLYRVTAQWPERDGGREGEGEGDRRPGREYRVTKDLLHPRPQTRFSSRNNTSIQSGKKWSEIGRPSERARIDDRGARKYSQERERKEKVRSPPS